MCIRSRKVYQNFYKQKRGFENYQCQKFLTTRARSYIYDKGSVENVQRIKLAKNSKPDKQTKTMLFIGKPNSQFFANGE